MPSLPIYCSISYGTKDLEFEVLQSKRKTLEISVHPDKTIVVKAPLSLVLEDVKKKVQQKATWINKQLKYFDQFLLKNPVRLYVGGETHYYLGSAFRLKIIDLNDLLEGESVYRLNSTVTLERPFFVIHTKKTNSNYIKNLLESWYRDKAEYHFEKVFEEIWQKFKRMNKLSVNDKPKLKIRKMAKRWGSLSKSGNLTLNPNLIKSPKECIEYVIIHELCHLIHFNHSKDFYLLLDRFLPDWMKRKHRLETKFL